MRKPRCKEEKDVIKFTLKKSRQSSNKEQQNFENNLKTGKAAIKVLDRSLQVDVNSVWGKVKRVVFVGASSRLLVTAASKGLLWAEQTPGAHPRLCSS